MAPEQTGTRLDVALRWAAYGLFYAYVLLLVVAGAWGALFPHADFGLIIGFDLPADEDQARSNLLSQYRFLRAIEFGAGMILVAFRHEVFSIRRFNRLFLLVISAGVMARLISLVVDGTPSWFFLFLIVSELAALIAVYAYTRRTGLADE